MQPVSSNFCRAPQTKGALDLRLLNASGVQVVLLIANTRIPSHENIYSPCVCFHASTVLHLQMAGWTAYTLTSLIV
jgi:hypothetical protein